MHLIKTLRVASIAALLTLAGHTFAQQQNESLYGLVVDNQGTSLPGVELQLRGPEPTEVRISGDNGKFQFVELRPGEYSVTAELEGFAPVTYDNIRILSGAATEIRITMTPASEQGPR
jgi:hypothetical protein